MPLLPVSAGRLPFGTNRALARALVLFASWEATALAALAWVEELEGVPQVPVQVQVAMELEADGVLKPCCQTPQPRATAKRPL